MYGVAPRIQSNEVRGRPLKGRCHSEQRDTPLEPYISPQRRTSLSLLRNCCRSATRSSRSRSRVATSIADESAASAPTGLGRSMRCAPAVLIAASRMSAPGTFRPFSHFCTCDLYTVVPMASLRRSAKACKDRWPRIAFSVSPTLAVNRLGVFRPPIGLKTITFRALAATLSTGRRGMCGEDLCRDRVMICDLRPRNRLCIAPN